MSMENYAQRVDKTTRLGVTSKLNHACYEYRKENLLTKGKREREEVNSVTETKPTDYKQMTLFSPVAHTVQGLLYGLYRQRGEATHFSSQ